MIHRLDCIVFWRFVLFSSKTFFNFQNDPLEIRRIMVDRKHYKILLWPFRVLTDVDVNEVYFQLIGKHFYGHVNILVKSL